MSKAAGGSQNPPNSSLKYTWSVLDYIRSVENSSHPLIKGYGQAEIDFLTSSIENLDMKTFIDVGAGYGRVLPYIAPPPSLEISLLLR